MPSKKTFALLVFSILIVGGVFVALHYKNISASTYVAGASQDIITDAALQNSDKDSDSDGLKDWEEVLWHTDPHNPDTDGDGTPDGQEVKEGRNPAVKGPNDKLNTQTIDTLINTGTGSGGELTQTDNVSRDLVGKLIALKESGATIDADTQNQLVQDSLKNLTGTTPTPYTQSDLHVTSNETLESIRQFGNQLGNIITKFSTSNTQDEITVLNQFITTGDQSILNKLDKNVTRYQNLIHDLLQVNVPKSVLPLYLGLVNGFNSLQTNIQNIKKYANDPVGQLVAINGYSANIELLKKVLAEMIMYFSTQHIQFTPQESGYIFIQKK